MREGTLFDWKSLKTVVGKTQDFGRLQEIVRKMASDGEIKFEGGRKYRKYSLSNSFLEKNGRK